MAETPLPAAIPPGHLLIQTAYVGINRADLLMRQGRYGAAPADGAVLGLEVSGHVVAMAENVTDFAINSPVMALLPDGGYADYVIAPARHCLPVPPPLSLAQAAALMEAATTLQMALIEGAAMKDGERVLIHGGGSGIGTLGIQIARARGADVFVTVGSEWKAEKCRALGASSILYKQEDFVSQIKEAGGADIIIDCVGGDYIARNLKALRPYGRLISLAFLQGADITLSAGGLLMKQLRWQGMSLRLLDDARKEALIANWAEWLLPLIASGEIQPVIDSVHDWQNVGVAHEKMQNDLHCGKILLQIGQNI